MVEAPWQPLRRITSAALPVKAANTILPSTPLATCLASVVLPVPAYPNSRNTWDAPRPGFDLSQAATERRAASWCGENFGMRTIGSEAARPYAVRRGFATPTRHGPLPPKPRGNEEVDKSPQTFYMLSSGTEHERPRRQTG